MATFCVVLITHRSIDDIAIQLADQTRTWNYPDAVRPVWLRFTPLRSPTEKSNPAVLTSCGVGGGGRPCCRRRRSEGLGHLVEAAPTGSLGHSCRCQPLASDR